MKISAKGLDNLIKSFGKLEGSTSEIAHRGLYMAAGVVADEVKQGVQSLPIQEDEEGNAPELKEGEKLSGITSREKASLLASMGIAQHREHGGSVSTSIGFGGVSDVTTKRFPDGVSNAGLMRAIESGTSIRKKHPVIRPALNRVRKKAKEAAEKEILNEISKEI